MGIQLYDRVDNIAGKGEITRNEQFLIFPQCFQKLSAVDASNEYLWSKGLMDLQDALYSESYNYGSINSILCINQLKHHSPLIFSKFTNGYNFRPM